MNKILFTIALITSVSFAKSDIKFQFLATSESRMCTLHGKLGTNDSANAVMVVDYKDSVAVYKINCPNSDLQDLKNAFSERSWLERRCNTVSHIEMPASLYY